MEIEFKEFPKIARLLREAIISEKLDGTNATIYIAEDGTMLFGSRNRWITPQDDNHGFAKWAEGNKTDLLKLGTGWHRGEWWGRGIQRNYGLKEKRFSLFNVVRWCLYGHVPQRIKTEDPRIEKFQDVLPECCGLVPVLHKGLFSTDVCAQAIDWLKENGSKAVPGFRFPEGIVVYHTGNGISFKQTVMKDEAPKSLS